VTLAGASWVRSDVMMGPPSHALRHPVMKKLIADLIACAFALHVPFGRVGGRRAA